MKVELNKYDNSCYSTGSNYWKRTTWFFINAFFFNSYLIPVSSFKVFLLRLFGSKVGKSVNIKPLVNIKYPWLLEIDDYSWIGEGVWIDNLARIKIAKHVVLSQGAMLLTGNHNYRKSSFDLIVKPIVLEDGVWICAKSVVCQGVVCRSHSILAVGSVATKNLEENGIYQGNPAVEVKKRVVE